MQLSGLALPSSAQPDHLDPRPLRRSSPAEGQTSGENIPCTDDILLVVALGLRYEAQKGRFADAEVSPCCYGAAHLRQGYSWHCGS